MATQPGHGWHDGTVTSWSHSIGIIGIVHALGLWHGVLAFGLGAVLGMSLDALPVVDEVVDRDAVVDRRRETVVDDTNSPTWRRRPADDGVVDDADEPVVAEREAAYDDEPRTVERSTRRRGTGACSTDRGGGAAPRARPHPHRQGSCPGVGEPDSRTG